MAKGKIEIVYDLESESLEIASERTLSLAEKQRILQKELLKTPEGTKQFDILNNSLNDTKDAMERVKVKSQDIYGTLSLLPGPIGGISSSVNTAVDSFKIFGGFKTSDLKAQFKNLGADIKDVMGTIGKLTGVTKTYDTINGLLGKTFGVTANSSKVASVAMKGFSAALTATGIGAIVTALGYLIGNFDQIKEAVMKMIPGLKVVGDVFTSIKNAVTDFFGVTSQGERDLEKFRKSTDRVNEGLEAEIAILEAQGASAKEIHEKKKQLINNELEYLRKALATKGELTEEEAAQFRKLKTDLAVEEAKFQADEKKKADEAAKEAASKAKDAAAQELNRKKAENQALIDLEITKDKIDEKRLRELLNKKLELEKLSGAARTKAIKDNEKIVDAALAGEIDRAKELAKSQQALADANKTKSQDTIQALKDEQAQAQQTYQTEAKAINDKMALYEKDSAEYQALLIQKNNLDAAYIKQQTTNNEAIKSAKEEQAESIKEIDEQIADEQFNTLKEGLEKQLQGIKDDGEKRKQAFKEKLDEALANGTLTAEKYAEKLKTFNAAVTEDVKNQTNAAVGEDFWNKLNESMDKAMLKAEGNFAKTKTAIADSQKALDDAYAKGKIAEADYTRASLQNQQLLRDASQQRVDAVNQLAASTGQLAQAMGEETAAGRVLIKVQQGLALVGTTLALVDAFKGIGKDLAKGFPTNLIAVASTLALIATAFMQAKALFGKNPKDLGKNIDTGGGAAAPASTGSKFAKGGLLTGPSHSQGGIKTGYGELEGGEFVVNKRSTRSFMPLLNAINSVGNRKYADGGITPSISDLQAMMADQQQTPIIKTYVVASDFYSQAEADKKIANLAKL